MTQSEEKFTQGTSYLMPFEKMHGLGNDFVMINNMHLPEDSNQSYEQELCKKICNRNTGIGADGIIIIDQVKESAEAIRSWRYYNSDGSIAEMCGNGIRCAAKYIYEHGLSGEATQFKIETLAGDLSVEMLDEEMVELPLLLCLTRVVVLLLSLWFELAVSLRWKHLLQLLGRVSKRQLAS